MREIKYVYAFVPCHDRRKTTIDTLIAIEYQLRHLPHLEIHLLDDGSSDGTGIEARQKLKTCYVHRLSGKHFWGGALNYIIDYCKYVIDTDHLGQSAVLIANDDLVFPNERSLRLGLDILQSVDADIIAPTVANVEVNSTRVAYISKNQTYDDQRNEYKDAKGEANIAVTVATWFSLRAMQHADYIPIGIPHYGSDFWLTHQLHKLGFKIYFNKNYTVGRYADTTRHSFAKTKRWGYWKSCCNPKSPDYLPATIKFEERFNNQQHRKIRLIILRLKYWFYRFLTRPKNNIALLEL